VVGAGRGGTGGTGEPLTAETAARATRARETSLNMAMVRERIKRGQEWDT